MVVIIIIIHLINNNNKRNKNPTTGSYSGLLNTIGCPTGTGMRRLLKLQLQSSTSSNTIASQDENWWCRQVIYSLCWVSLDPSFFLPGMHWHTLFFKWGQWDMAFSTGLCCHVQYKNCQSLHVFDAMNKANQLLSWRETTGCKYFHVQHFAPKKSDWKNQLQKCKWNKNWLFVCEQNMALFFFLLNWSSFFSCYSLGFGVSGFFPFFLLCRVCCSFTIICHCLYHRQKHSPSW